ncbi:MAG: hypothetical protein AB1716_20000 [Planctomycetota bacterium]
MSARPSRNRIVRGGLLLGLLALAGCSRPPAAAGAAGPASTSAPAAASLTPRQVLERMVALRAAQRYRDLPEFIAPGRGDTVVKFLIAVDHFLTANRHLCNWIRDNAGLGLSQTIDQAYVLDDLAVYAGEDLGVFGRHIELLETTIRGETAVVAYALGEQMPLRSARLARIDGNWRFDPGPGGELLPAAFDDLARGLELALVDFQTGRVTSEELRGDPQVLIEKVRVHLRHGVNLLSKAAATRLSAQAGSSGRG